MKYFTTPVFYLFMAMILLNVIPSGALLAQQCPLPDVEGIVTGNVYTYSSVISTLGQPTSYWSGKGEEGLDEEYYFETNLLRFRENGSFSAFVLKNNRFAIYTSRLNGGIKVGDSLSKFRQLGFGSLTLNTDGNYRFNIEDFWIDIEHNNGIITKLRFSIPV